MYIYLKEINNHASYNVKIFIFLRLYKFKSIFCAIYFVQLIILV